MSQPVPARPPAARRVVRARHSSAFHRPTPCAHTRRRRAWTGLGTSRREDLQSAAANYAIADAIEMREAPLHPSPYARLNQVTLEMLAGTGRDEERKE